MEDNEVFASDDGQIVESGEATVQATEFPAADDAFTQVSSPYLGRWHRLVSQTNWEKGRIIAEWRETLRAADAPVSAWSDDAWSRSVGNVSSQHVGRLRRVWERFGAVAETFEGLYWSHFQAALDWHDSEMWLEGALQNDWSVSQMRRARWEATGGRAEDEPNEAAELATAEYDEDAAGETFDAPSSQARVREAGPTEFNPGDAESHSADDDEAAEYDQTDAPFSDDEGEPAVAVAGPLAGVAELPEDMADAFDSFKLAIVRHKLSGWSEISAEQVVEALEGLKRLAVAPAE